MENTRASGLVVRREQGGAREECTPLRMIALHRTNPKVQLASLGPRDPFHSPHQVTPGAKTSKQGYDH